MDDAYSNMLKEYDADRCEAFKRINEQFHKSHRRTKEMLKWYRAHPSPRHPVEQLENLKRALAE